ncbi:hypothetical protein DRJ25_05285, partial [Candidatus Woesearchaeota archaeon]
MAKGKYAEGADIYRSMFEKEKSSMSNFVKEMLERLRARRERNKIKGIISKLIVYSPTSMQKPKIVTFTDKRGVARPLDEIAKDLKDAVNSFDPEFNELAFIFVTPRGILKSSTVNTVKGQLRTLLTSQEGFNIKLKKDIIVKGTISEDQAKAMISKKLSDAVKNDITLTARSLVERLSPDEILDAAAAADPIETAKILKKYNLDRQKAAIEIAERIKQRADKLFVSTKKPVSRIGKEPSPEQKKREFYTKVMMNILKKDPNTREKLERYAPLIPRLKSLLKETFTSNANLAKSLNVAKTELALKQMKELKSKKSIRKFLDILRKNDPRLKDDVTLLEYLQTPSGKKHAADILEGLVKSNPKEWSEGVLRTLERNLGITAPYAILEKLKEREGIEYKINRKAEINARKAVAAALYGQPGNYNQLLTRSMYKLLAQDPQFKEIAVKATKEGATEKIEEFVKQKLQSMKISYGELQAMLNTANVRKDVLERLKAAGVQIEDIPEVKETVDEIKAIEKAEKKGLISKLISPKGEIAVKKPKVKSGLIFGSTEIKFRKGGKLPLVEEYVGRITPAGIRARIQNYLASLSEREKRKIEKRIRKYKQLGLDQVLSPEELIVLASTKDPIYKARKLLQARRMLTDEAYYEKVMSKKLKKKTEVELQTLKMVKEFQKRRKALQSPFWGAWYKLSTRTKLILTFVIPASILFMPVGLFYVGGWALAAGIVALVSFIIWVFMETWFLIAQGIVGLINFVGQAIINAINAAGRAVCNFLGYSFNPMSFQLIQNMRINIGEGKGFTWGAWNLVPPSFLRLEHFMPTTFDTDPIIAKIYPPLASLFKTIYGPIAERYTAWIKTAEW